MSLRYGGMGMVQCRPIFLTCPFRRPVKLNILLILGIFYTMLKFAKCVQFSTDQNKFSTVDCRTKHSMMTQFSTNQ